MARWNDVYPDFVRALNSPETFDPFRWVLRLARAAWGEGLHRMEALTPLLIPLLPWFAVSLVLLVDFAYFWTLRRIFASRWCSAVDESCLWMPLHDTIAVYFSFMILFHYIHTSFTSPGVVLPSDADLVDWKASQFQGGFLGINPRCDVERERAFAKRYEQTSDKSRESLSDIPSTSWTQCDKCVIPLGRRPPRCHHCRTCRRCVLQFDHHCIWLNQCIGYGNYRHFVLLLFFLMTGCWYGVAMLFLPFYEPLKALMDEHGVWYMATHGLRVPGPILLYHMVRSDGIPDHVVVDLVYPLVLGIGTVLSAFLGYHLKYILTARTTLEHHMKVTTEYNSAIRGEERPKITNPYDQCKLGNLRRVLGPSLWLTLLPTSIDPPPPFLPGVSIKSD